MLGFAILLLFYLIGYVLQAVLHIPLPANVIGLLLFTLALFLKIIRLDWVEEAGIFLIRHMMLLFAPIVVGTMVFFSFIGSHAVSIVVSLFLSTFGVLLVTGWSVSKWGKNKNKETEQL
ncbi:CidA/LrgA family protein [Paenibacillus sp. IITD108]|uniref:CidA/LrgA family protein n=1 Tax=Paenibacillus sp. IITD108 TaxID=3116649 RepID=UPI002F41283E